MFTALPPGPTGVVTENNFADPTMWWERYQEFTIGAVGTGLAIGDYDNDGRADLFVVSKTETSRLFRNLGDWRFEDVTEQAGLAPARAGGSGWSWLRGLVGGDESDGEKAPAWGHGAAFADVNNDGRLDLYVCRLGAPNFLYMNQGDGTFREEAADRGLAVVDGSGMAAFADFDRDGWLDVYLQTNLLNYVEHPNGQRDYLFRNLGDGRFVDVTQQAGLSFDETQGHSATWWDYNDDGWPDIYVANDFSPPDRLYRNNGDGTFTDVIDRVAPHTPFSAMGADLGDVNNDGLIDFFVADMASTSAAKDLRGMAESRNWTKEVAGTASQYPRNALLLSTGGEFCLEAAFLTGLSATDWTWSPRFEDLDNDGRLDLHVTNGMVRELNNQDLVMRVSASNNAAERIQIMRKSPVLAESNLAFRNLGDLRFEDVSQAWGLDHTGVSFGSAFGDLDGDGDLDLAYSNFQDGVTLLRNDGDTGHRVTIRLRGTRSNPFGVGATVRLETDAGIQVRQLVLARGYMSTSEPILHFGLGAASRIRRLTVDWPSGRQQVFEDLAVDRHFTIVEPSQLVFFAAPEKPVEAAWLAEVGRDIGFALRVQPERTEEIQQKLVPVRQNRRGPAIAVGDLNGDGFDDVCVGGTTLEPARVLIGMPSGGFVVREVPALGRAANVSDGPLLIFDANADGANDLLLTRGGAVRRAGAPDYQPQLLLNDGRGGLAPASADALPELPISAGAVAAADFDRDGRLDLFLGGRIVPGRYPVPAQSALLANRATGFIDVTASVAPALREIGLVTAVLWTDVDDDGWLDLLLALEWGGIRFWRNIDGRAFEDLSEAAGFSAAGSGWWSSLAAADFNGDGRLDYVAGNLGLNTQYQASPDHPALLFLGNFGGGGGPTLIEARWEGDRLVPWRNLKDLGAAVPSIRQRFASNEAYVRASLPELLGEERLAAAQRFAATEFRSGVFLSGPEGRFKFQPLPRIAQIAPLQGIVAGDFDGDGHADICAVQNSFAPVSVIGRFDGGVGQFLRGDGRGGFEAPSPRATGLVVPGDGEALAVVDLQRDGWPDFLVSQNGDSTLAFRHAGFAERRAFRVVLRGAAGNPTAIGARLTLELADGSKQTCELYSGSGYMSQSAAGCFFGWSPANPPRRLHVRWPSSQVTVHDVSEPRAEWEIRAP